MAVNIITRSDYDSEVKHYIDVFKEGDNITVSFFYPGQTEDDLEQISNTTFELSKIENNLYAIYKDNLENLTPLISSENTGTRSGYSALQVAYNIGFAHPFINVFRNGNEFYVLTYTVPVRNTNLNIIKRYEKCHTMQILKQYCDGELLRKKEIFGYKSKNIIFAIEPADTLSYLEPQVDILGKILFTLLGKIDGSVKENLKQEIPELETIEQVFADYSVLNIKSVDKCLEEMNTKAKVRRLQQDYYNYKAEIERNPS